MDIFDQIRKEYENRGIRQSDLADDPLVEFDKWLQRAIDQAPGSWFEPNAMTLSTSNHAGQVTSRTVLLKKSNRDGLVFFTNYSSEKARQLQGNPQAALLFHWPYLGQQVRIQGSVSKTSRDVSEEYFHSRPRGSQIGALASHQSAVLNSREELEAAAQQLEDEFHDQQIPLPETWGGYCLDPVVFEFWQGRTNRLHDRVHYFKQNGAWTKQRLAP